MAAGAATDVPTDRATHATPDSTKQAARALAKGALAILPTDTVFGICADIRVDEAVLAIYTAKGGQKSSPLQLLFPFGSANLANYAELTTSARALVEALGPGAWTVITRARDGWDSPALA
ncbi:MAG: Sua5/YciO/YrdC/YwlC family protein, partial [Dehalococcoidia bacterium]